MPWLKSGPDTRAQHLLDLFPGLGGQVQDPEIFVVVELLPVGRGKLAPEDPELPPSRGHHSCLQDKGQLGQSRIPNLAPTSPCAKHTAPNPREQQQQLSGAEGRKEGEFGLKVFSTSSLGQGKAGLGAGLFPPPGGSSVS